MYLVASLFFQEMLNLSVDRGGAMTSEEYFSSDSKVHHPVQLLIHNKT